MYKPAPLPNNEARRLAALRALEVLDSEPEGIFDVLANTAAALCDAPVALVSLIDADRQWFKSNVGLTDVHETPRDLAFCSHVVASGDFLEVCNASQDERFADHPMVTGPPNIQFYAGAPICVAGGLTLGSLCIIDHVPRKLTAHQLEALHHLAEIAARGLESRALALRAIAVAQQANADLARGREFLQVTLDSIVDSVITTDPFGCVHWMNPAAQRATGWSYEEAAGTPLTQVFVVFDEETRTFAPSPVDLCLGNDWPVVPSTHLMLVARDGNECGIECAASAMREADGRMLGTVLTFRDVSEQRRMHNELSHRALHDVLTDLPNRAAFETAVGKLLIAGSSGDVEHALMYIDLDQFKLVNDACGHAAGDQLLRQISDIVKGCVRADDLLARLGGDEFALLLAHCDLLHAQDIAQKICDQLDAFRFVYEGRRFRVGASIGLVPLNEKWASVTAAVQAADASCYAAKEEGRNRVHIWRESDRGLETRQGEMHWVSRIELALDEDRFELYGQCIAPIATPGGGLHFEVLLRMREPNGDLTMPGAFLPVAERFHLATRIDRCVVRKAFDWMTQAADSGVDIELMSINLSGQSLSDRAFHRDLVETIRAAHFDARRVCLEITETAAITHLSEARTFIEEIRALGVKVALDDFGAGASSFGYLKSLPVDFLKIDGHFITHLLDDEIDNVAVRCFCEVAKVMRIRTIAEFVEREDVRTELLAIGVDMAQGYLIHHPEPLADLLSSVSMSSLAFTMAGDDVHPMTRARPVTEIALVTTPSNRLDVHDEAEVMLLADDLGIGVDRLREIATRVGPMRAAIRCYAGTQARATKPA